MRRIAGDVTQIAQTHDFIGETPTWSPSENCLYWINVLDDPAIRRIDPSNGHVTSWNMPDRIGALVLKEGGGAIVALSDGIYDFDFTSGDLRLRAPSPFPDPANVPLHEGRCDPTGRFWIGSTNNAFLTSGELGGANLFRLDGDVLTPVADGFTISNGLAFSPDGRTLYAVDSARGTIWAWDCERETGALSNRRDFASYPFEMGGLDGAAVDEEGGYWSAVFGAGLLRRWREDGTPDMEIQLPFTQPTMLAFGGKDLDTLFITTGWFMQDEAGRASQPQLGGLYAMKAPLRGLPEPLFKQSVR